MQRVHPKLILGMDYMNLVMFSCYVVHTKIIILELWSKGFPEESYIFSPVHRNTESIEFRLCDSHQKRNTICSSL